jgi:hypothetical protein
MLASTQFRSRRFWARNYFNTIYLALRMADQPPIFFYAIVRSLNTGLN